MVAGTVSIHDGQAVNAVQVDVGEAVVLAVIHHGAQDVAVLIVTAHHFHVIGGLFLQDLEGQLDGNALLDVLAEHGAVVDAQHVRDFAGGQLHVERFVPVVVVDEHELKLAVEQLFQLPHHRGVRVGLGQGLIGQPLDGHGFFLCRFGHGNCREALAQDAKHQRERAQQGQRAGL